MKSWLVLLSILIAQVCYCYGDFTCQAGKFFKYELDKDDFSADPQLKGKSVTFKFSTEDNYPSLPSWVDLEQRTVESKAYLYGSPNNWDKTSKIQVIGWDKSTNYSTKNMIEVFDVIPNGNGFPWFQAEFLITNMNLDGFLDNNTHKDILKIVKENYWPSDDLECTLVETALGRGGRIPLPNSNGYEGVYVRVGSHQSWNESSPKVHLEARKKPSKDFFVANNYIIDWKNFTWLDLRTLPSPEARRQELLPKDKIITTDDYVAREYDDSPRDFDSDFILVVILPIIIILVLVILLSIVMCCGREGRKKRDEQTPNMQLTHHHNIQRSTYRLRELSKPQDQEQTSPSPTPPSDERPPRGQNEYTRLPDDGDDDRNDGRNAPPPYRMPPTEGGASGGQQV